MTGIIQPLTTEDQLAAYVQILANAYPVLKLNSTQDHQNLTHRLLALTAQDPTLSYWGLYGDDVLLGGMRLHDFTMNLGGTPLKAGGIGGVAVDLCHKKAKVCRTMVAFYLAHYRQKGVPLALLYPFNPEFYRRMGFGFGTRLYRYRIQPPHFPLGPKAHIRLYTLSDQEALLRCQALYQAQTHGLFAMTFFEQDRLLNNQEQRILVFAKDNEIRGYMVMRFALEGNALHYDLEIKRLVYLDPAVLQEFLAFLHTQSDQIRTVWINTQEEGFHHLLRDPRNGTEQLVALHQETATDHLGLMYRVLDFPLLFQHYPFGDQSGTFALQITDNFLTPAQIYWSFALDRGQLLPQPPKTPQVTISLDIADFSSLVLGAVDAVTLHRYGLLTLCDPGYLDRVQGLFSRVPRPQCMTEF